MSYTGAAVRIPLGQGGLHTDDSQGTIPVTSLIEAKNIGYGNGLIEKKGGSKKWNSGFALPSTVQSLFDWWPTDYQQRLIAFCGDGKVYRQDSGFAAAVEITPRAATATPATLRVSNQAHMVSGGLETPSKQKKLFLFTGADPIQVMTADAVDRNNVASGATEWTGTNHPSFGIIHRDRLFVMGMTEQPSLIYASNILDHEDFSSTNARSYNVFPGEGERLIGGWVFKGRLFVAKYPRSVFYLVDTDPDSQNWYFQKLNTNFGVASPHSFIEVKDDMLVCNSTGSITSLSAAFQLGDVEAADVLNQLRNERYMRERTSQASYRDRWAVYHEDKKIAYITYKSPTGIYNDRMLEIDVSHGNPMVAWSYKDQANCLAMQKDQDGVPRPIYGSNDGFVYILNQPDRDVGGVAYDAEFQTPHMDLGSPGEKLLDFLELTFEPTGNWNVSVEVFIDGVYYETIQYPVYYGDVLDRFILDKGKLGGRIPRSIRKPLHGKGRSVSFKVKQTGLDQDFRISSMTVYFRQAGQAQRDPSK